MKNPFSKNPTIRAFEQWYREIRGDVDTMPEENTKALTFDPVFGKCQQGSTLQENVEWLLNNITFPPEFYPENGMSRPKLKKVFPFPFLRIKGNDRQVIAFNPSLQQYELIGIKAAAERVERFAASTISIQNSKGDIGDSSTQAEKAILAIADKSPQVVYFGLMGGYEGGVYQNATGELFVVPKTIPITPAAPVTPEDETLAKNPPPGFVLFYEQWKPLWEELFCPALRWEGGGDEAAQFQIDTLFKWLAGVRAVLMGKAELKFTMLCFVGDAGSGKTLLNSRIIDKSLNGQSCNPTPYLYGETIFNAPFMESPHWSIDDQEIREKKCNAKIKEIIVGDGIQVVTKYEKATPIIYPYIAITLCANNDKYSRKTIPIIGNDNREKIIILKTYSGIPNHSQEQWEELIENALPYFLAFLDYQVWPQLQAEIPLRETKTGRLVVPGWQNPEITGGIFEDTKDGALHEALQEYLRKQPEESGQEHTAGEWLRLIEKDKFIFGDLWQTYCNTEATFGRAIQRLIDNQFCPKCYSKRRDRNQGRLIKMELNEKE